MHVNIKVAKDIVFVNDSTFTFNSKYHTDYWIQTNLNCDFNYKTDE